MPKLIVSVMSAHISNADELKKLNPAIKQQVVSKYAKGYLLFTFLLSVKDAAGHPISKLAASNVHFQAFVTHPTLTSQHIVHAEPVQLKPKKITVPYLTGNFLFHEAFAFLAVSPISRPWWIRVEVKIGSDAGETFVHVQ
jgi:hypothetical protein